MIEFGLADHLKAIRKTKPSDPVALKAWKTNDPDSLRRWKAAGCLLHRLDRNRQGQLNESNIVFASDWVARDLRALGLWD